MNTYGYDQDMTTEYGSGISVDDILSEFEAQWVRDSFGAYQPERPLSSSWEEPFPQGSYTAPVPQPGHGYTSPASRTGSGTFSGFSGYTAYEPTPTPKPSVYTPPVEYATYTPASDVDDDDVRVYTPKSALSGMEAEARRYIADMQSHGYSGLREERAYNTRSGAETDDTFPAAEKKHSRASVAVAERESGRAAENTQAEPEIDSRFNIGQDRQSSLQFNGRAVDVSADDDYVPPEQAFAASRYAEEGEAASDAASNRKGKWDLSQLGRRKQKKRPLNAPPVGYGDDDDDFAAGFRDYNASPGEYAPQGDYEEEFAKEASRGDHPDISSFPSFKDYLVSLVTGMLFRARGFTGSGTATMVDSSEDLGAEVNPTAAYKYYGAFVHSLRLRFRISLVLELIMCYISLGLPVLGMLKSAHVAAGMCLAIQLTIMLLSLDVVTGAVMNIGRRRLGADTMAVIACLFTSVDALAVTSDLFGSVHMPLCALSSLSLCGVLLASFLSARGFRKALRVPAIGKHAFSVTAEAVMKEQRQDITLLKSVRPTTGFVRRAEEAAPDETVFIRLAPFILGSVALLTLIAAIATKSFDNILYILTAILSPAVPVTALLSFALPYCVGSLRIFNSGAAIAGWSGLCDIGQSRNLIVTDRDLFPESSIELENIRIFADEDSDKIISYAGTMIVASGSCIASCFGELMEKHGCTLRQVENFEYLAGGGMRGVIDGSTVLCGSTDLMRLMNVRIPFRLVDRTTVLLAVDGVLYGIFNMKYTPQPQVRKALVSLMRSNRHPVFAIRDFNITPEMLSRSFDIPTDGYDFPPYVERFSISEAKPSEDSKIAAVVCREGLGPLTHMADTGRSMYVTTRLNILLSLLSVVIGVISVFIKLVTTGFVGPGFLLAFMLIWALPVFVLSVFLKF